MDDVKAAIRSVPDFPKPGILFYDITTILQDPKHFKKIVDELVHRYGPMKISKILQVCVFTILVQLLKEILFNPAQWVTLKKNQLINLLLNFIQHSDSIDYFLVVVVVTLIANVVVYYYCNDDCCRRGVQHQ